VVDPAPEFAGGGRIALLQRVGPADLRVDLAVAERGDVEVVLAPRGAAREQRLDEVRGRRVIVEPRDQRCQTPLRFNRRMCLIRDSSSTPAALDRGAHELRGVPAKWSLFVVNAVADS
jgi:hypothetical protein